MGVTRRSTRPGSLDSLARRRTGKQARSRLGGDDIERARRLLRIDEEERRRLSLALHETVTQALAALAMNLDLIEHEAALGGRTRRLLLTSRHIVRDCFRHVRMLTDQLSPPLVAELGLRLAVQCVVAGFSERTGITVVCETADCPRLSDDLELALLRVVEDCLDNLDPLVSEPAVVIMGSNRAVELHVQPVRPNVGVRWRHRMLLQFGSTVDVRIERLMPNTQREPTRVGLVVVARGVTPTRL
jgi:signal transduction histidine kinase